MIRRLLRAPALLAFPLALLAGACTERLDTSAGCPALCPGQSLEILDTVIDPAIVLDTTLVGYPPVGFESPLYLATRGDTLDVRPIVRFDSLARLWTPANDTLQPITRVDSVTLVVRLAKTGLPVAATYFIDAYDVGDTTLVDSLPATLLPLFVPGRLLGSLEVNGGTLGDTATVSIPLDTARMRAIVTTPGQVMRFGLRLRGASSGAFWITPSDDQTNGPRLRYRVSPDTLVAPFVVRPNSFTPREPSFIANDFPDYNLVATAPDIRAAGRVAVGGLPGARGYLRFDLPRWLLDSTAVLRAQLELVQDPIRGLDDTNKVVVRAQLGIAGWAVTDLHRAARLTAGPAFYVGDSIVVSPADSGVRRFEINALLSTWRLVDGRQPIPSAIILRSEGEGYTPLAARFFGLNGPAALRPRLRVSYVPSIRFGQP